MLTRNVTYFLFSTKSPQMSQIKTDFKKFIVGLPWWRSS